MGEASTTKIARRSDAQGFVENRTTAIEGGTIAGNARKALEAKTGQSVVSKSNFLTAPAVFDVLEDTATMRPPKPDKRPRARLPKDGSIGPANVEPHFLHAKSACNPHGISAGSY